MAHLIPFLINFMVVPEKPAEYPGVKLIPVCIYCLHSDDAVLSWEIDYNSLGWFIISIELYPSNIHVFWRYWVVWHCEFKISVWKSFSFRHLQCLQFFVISISATFLVCNLGLLVISLSTFPTKFFMLCEADLPSVKSVSWAYIASSRDH